VASLVELDKYQSCYIAEPDGCQNTYEVLAVIGKWEASLKHMKIDLLTILEWQHTGSLFHLLVSPQLI